MMVTGSKKTERSYAPYRGEDAVCQHNDKDGGRSYFGNEVEQIELAKMGSEDDERIKRTA